MMTVYGSLVFNGLCLTDYIVWAQETIITGAWDNTIKLWHPNEQRSLRTFKGHRKCIYSTVWHPKNPDLFASTSGDCTLKIWDCNGSVGCILFVTERDWLCSGGADRLSAVLIASSFHGVSCFDLPLDEKAVQTIPAHKYEILTCDWNKYADHVIATGSVDKTIRLWVCATNQACAHSDTCRCTQG